MNKKDIQIENINGVDCYVKDGTAYLKLETVARGLGFTEIAKSGNECVRWRTVRKYLKDLGIATSCDGENLPEFIPENIFYRLAMNEKQVVKVKNSDVNNVDFRKLNNAGENFITIRCESFGR